ncbi:MAG: hypothetical protein IJ229_04550 [Clostridia bacterium]|nr:hypothetical protein [Clostridia bacterium]MBR1685872.1 hypothetical protein [Clostridia bacterium]
MRRPLCFLLSLLLCLSLEAAFSETLTVVTRGGPVNLRKSANMDDRSKISVPKGENVEVVEYVSDEVAFVRWKEQEGYMPLKYLKREEDILSDAYPKGKSYYPDQPLVYVRKTASDTGEIIAAVRWDQPVRLIRQGKAWHKVACVSQKGKSVTGYLRADALAELHTQPLGGNLFETPARLREEGIADAKLTLRMLPDLTSEVTAIIPEGHGLTVLSIDEPWCYVAAGVYEGWVHLGGFHLTGKASETFDREVFTDYQASYYTARPKAGTVTLYAEPTSKMSEEAIGQYDVSEWIVLQRSKSAYRQKWTNVWDGNTTSGWVVSSELRFSEDRQVWDYGKFTVQAYTSAICYVKEGGAVLYAAATDLSNKLLTIPAGTELEVSLRPGDFVSTGYAGQHGYVPFSQLETGFAWDTAWWSNANRTEEEKAATRIQVKLDRGAAQRSAEQALSALSSAFRPEKLDMRVDSILDSSGRELYAFAYLQGDDCLFLARIDAYSGECVYRADYTAFVQKSGGDKAVDWDPAAPQKKAKSTPRPAASGDVGIEKARQSADAAVAGEYGVSLSQYNCVGEYQQQMTGFDMPVYRFNYYAENGYLLCVVDAASGKAVYTNNVYQAEYTEIDYNPPEVTESVDHTGETLLSESSARAKADAALSTKYPDFAHASFSQVQSRFHGTGEGDSFGENYYQFDYFEDGIYTYSCYVNGYTGKILYLFGHLPDEGNG